MGNADNMKGLALFHLTSNLLQFMSAPPSKPSKYTWDLSSPHLHLHLLHLVYFRNLQTRLHNTTFAHFLFIFPRVVEVIP